MLGNQLAVFLQHHIESHSLSISEFARRASMSQSYLSLLLQSDRPSEKISFQKLRQIAKSTDIPSVLAFVLSGALSLEMDFSTQSGQVAKLVISEEWLKRQAPGLCILLAKLERY